MDKILHIISDDKFANFVHQEFSKNTSAENHYLCINKSAQLTHVKFPCDYYWDGSYGKLISLKQNINEYSKVIIHFLSVNAQKILSILSPKIKVIWIGWGGDYYWLIDTLPLFNLYLEKTKRLTKSNNFYLIKKIKKLLRIRKLNLINRIDYFSPVLEVEYNMIKKNHPSFKPSYLAWNYGNLQDNYINGFEKFEIKGNSLLIGNSATPTNNHLDILSELNRMNVVDRFEKVIMPLGYGDESYKRFLVEYTQQNFESKIYMITDFLPYDMYLEILKKTGNVVMGHIRQQAMGNIITLLYLGAKIYFFENSVVYQDLVRKGYCVFKMEDLSNQKLTHNPLSSEVIANHQMLLNREWSNYTNLINTNNICSI